MSEKLGLTVTRLRSDTTFRRILQKRDFQTLAQQFEQWVNSTFTLAPREWVAVDGKSIKGTVTAPGTAYQNFISLVSLSTSQPGIVLASQQFESKHNSELKVVLSNARSVEFRSSGVHSRCLALPRHVCGGGFPRKAGLKKLGG